MSFDFMKDRNKKVHFIGIGGISMSGLAEILLEHGFTVSGSDRNASPLTDMLKDRGAEIHIGHDENNVKTANLVVYTAAVAENNPELVKAKELNIPTLDRAEFLGYLMKDFKYNVAISGTHGKTSTTSMISHIALKSNLDPTILVGGQLDIINGNVRSGHSEYFITEACEYKASFLKFFPYVGVILNIEADHLDYYKDLNHIKETFKKFIALIPEDGCLVACGEDENIKEVISDAKCNVLTYGISEGDLTAKNIVFNERGGAVYDCYKGEDKLFAVTLNVPGRHNILNSLASIGAALSLNVPYEAITEGLESFYGTHRRFEKKGEINGITVIDDYAHHPTEIKACLSAAKNLPHNKIHCIFQPHTYTRTITLFDEFTNCFFDADKLILANIYAAREADTGIVSSQMLGDKIRENGMDCKNFHSFDEIVAHLKATVKPGDLVMTVGAGDVVKIGEMYLKDAE